MIFFLNVIKYSVNKLG